LIAASFLLAAGEARALVCGASYQAAGHKPTPWKDLGEVSGPQRVKNCLAMAKNKLGNLKAADLGVPKQTICESGPVAVSIYTRLDAKDKRETADAIVTTALGVDCGKAKAPDAPPAKKDAAKAD